MKAGPRLLAEGFVIVVSVLVALGADAWWGSRQDAERVRLHMVALARDFDQMSDRVDRSLEVTQGAMAAVRVASIDASIDSVAVRMRRLLGYEVFSPSTGAYDALVASGDLGLLADIELQRALGDFFGGFDDVRVSEEALLRSWDFLTQDEEFVTLVGFQGLLGSPVGEEEMAQFLASPSVTSRVLGLYNAHGNVLEDYQWLRARIDEIRELLPSVEE